MRYVQCTLGISEKNIYTEERRLLFRRVLVLANVLIFFFDF